MEELNEQNYVFQTDSKIVQEVYHTKSNYLIDYNPKGNKKYCAIYFCSNDIYYPNTEEILKKRIVEKDFYEWYNSRITKAYKHLFIRDIFKQWYLGGINSQINTPEKLLDFLRKETFGYHLITIGSSAGAYAAILYGSILQAEKVIAFNPHCELNSLLKRSSEQINPLLFRLKDSDRNKYFDITSFINKNIDIFYFYSNKSQWDIEQNLFLRNKNIKGILQIPFSSRHHGIPFLKVALPIVLNLETKELKKYTKHIQNPLLFTIKMVGIKKTLVGFWQQIYQSYRKRH